MKPLHLNLKKKWFDMILSGEKTEEYRDLTQYFTKKFFGEKGNLNADLFLSNLLEKRILEYPFFIIDFEKTSKDWHLKPAFDTIIFSNGYAKNRPQFSASLEYMRIGNGKEQWGAEKEINYFVLVLGKIKRL